VHDSQRLSVLENQSSDGCCISLLIYPILLPDQKILAPVFFRDDFSNISRSSMKLGQDTFQEVALSVFLNDK